MVTFNFLAFIITGLLSISVFAFDDGILHSLQNAQEDSKDEIPDSKQSKKITATKSMKSAVVCEEKFQKSLTLRTVHSLLLERGSKLKPIHNPDTGELKIYGGRMIGNCNGMLDYVISPPGEGLPYVFQVKVRGCGEEKCSYKVKVKEEGKTVDKDMVFESNEDGFQKCLEETGVLTIDGSKVITNKDKIVKSNFYAASGGVTQASELIFASDGPRRDPKSGVYNKSGHTKDGFGCFYFENIVDGGMVIKSFEEVEFNRKNNEAKNLCSEQNYKLISKRLSDFNGFDELQEILIKARNDLLEDEVKGAANTLRRLAKAKKLDKMEPEALRELIEDFKVYIVDPLKKEIVAQYDRLMNAPKGERAREQKRLTALVKKLKKYAVKPFVSAADHKAMQSFEAKAPIDDESWAEAVLMINRMQNTMSVYQQYGKSKGDKEDPEDADERVNIAQGKFARQYAVLRDLDGDPKYSKVKDLKSRSTNLRRAIQRENQRLQKDKQKEIEYMYKHCYGKYYIANNPLMRKSCENEVRENIHAWSEETYYGNQERERLASAYDQEAQRWSKVEGQRNAAYGVKGSRGGSEGRYNFNYQNNTTRTANGPMPQNNPFQMQQNFSYPAMTFQQPMNPNFGANPNFLPGQYNMGFNGGFNGGMAMGPGGFNSPPRGPAGFQQPWAYGGQQTSPWNMGPQYSSGMPPAYGGAMATGGYQFNI